MLKKTLFLLFTISTFFIENSFAQASCTGTLGNPLINITFGNGQNPGAPLATSVPGASTSYTYVAPTGTPPLNIIIDGNYSLVNQIPSNAAWLAGSPDHTGQVTGSTDGYMAFFNARPQIGEFYRQTVPGLCPGTTYEFAAWIVNAIRNSSAPTAAAPNVTFSIFDQNNLSTPLVSFVTGPIPSANFINWQRFSTLFITPFGVNTIVLSLSNTVQGGNQNVGNDLAIDDITFRACGPLTLASFSAASSELVKTVCSGVDINLYGTLVGGLNNPTYQWEISSNNGVTWSNISGATTQTFIQPGLAVGNYKFRFISAENGNINTTNCRFISNIIDLTVTECNACTDNCYWKVTGNNILNNNNIFGTLTNDNVQIQTNSTNRGIISSSGNLGWNTSTPTAFLHVNCNGGNPNEGIISDVRFEGLESGSGSIVVIDKQGYIHNSRIPVGSSLSNNCYTPNVLPKVADINGNLTCSQIYDDGNSVGINTTGPFNYTWSGGLTGSTFPPTSGLVRLDVAGVTRSLAYIATSDERYKESINKIENPMGIINSLNGKTYKWNEKAKNEIGADNYKQYGFIAQEVKSVLPEAVVVDKKGYHGIYYNAFIPILVEGQKELYKLYLIEKNKNEILENKLNDLTNKVEGELRKLTSEKYSLPTTKNMLLQNVPNPFQNETNIEFEISKIKTSAFLLISDLTGKEIKKYSINNVGKGKVNFKNKDLSSGIYIYSLIVDNNIIDSKKMVISN